MQSSGQINFNPPQTQPPTPNLPNSTNTNAPTAQAHEIATDEHNQSDRENSATSNQTAPTNNQEQKLAATINRSINNLLHIKSFSLLEMLRSEVIIDITKITFIIRKFLMPKQTISVAIQDIVEVEVNSIPFFATLVLQTVMTDEDNHIIRITHLKKDEANKARRFIQGLEIAMKQGIDLTQVKDEQLLSRIEELGHTST